MSKRKKEAVIFIFSWLFILISVTIEWEMKMIEELIVMGIFVILGWILIQLIVA